MKFINLDLIRSISYSGGYARSKKEGFVININLFMAYLFYDCFSPYGMIRRIKVSNEIKIIKNNFRFCFYDLSEGKRVCYVDYYYDLKRLDITTALEHSFKNSNYVFYLPVSYFKNVLI